MKSVNLKISSFVFLLIIVATAIVAMEKISSIAFTYMQEHQANAQLNNNNTSINSTNKTNALPPLTRYPTSSAIVPPSENWTGSIQTSPTIGQAIASKVHVSIANASTIAEKAVGKGSHTVLAMLETDRGFLVYTTWVVDSNYNFNRVIVDPANGKVLFNQPLTLTEVEQSRMILRGMLHPSLNTVPPLLLAPPPPSQPFPPLATTPLPNGGAGAGGMTIPTPPPPVTGIIPGRP